REHPIVTILVTISSRTHIRLSVVGITTERRADSARADSAHCSSRPGPRNRSAPAWESKGISRPCYEQEQHYWQSARLSSSRAAEAEAEETASASRAST